MGTILKPIYTENIIDKNTNGLLVIQQHIIPSVDASSESSVFNLVTGSKCLIRQILCYSNSVNFDIYIKNRDEGDDKQLVNFNTLYKKTNITIKHFVEDTNIYMVNVQNEPYTNIIIKNNDTLVSDKIYIQLLIAQL